MTGLATASAPRRALLAALAAAAVLLAAFAVWRLGEHGNTGADDRADREHPIVTAPRIAVQDGRTLIRLDAAAVTRAGIRTQAVVRAAMPQTELAFATVVDVQPLAQRAAAIAAAMAQAQAAQAKLEASRAEAQRSRELFAQDQAVSASQMQLAQAAFLADQAALSATQAQVHADRANARLEWGPVLGDALPAAGSAGDGAVDGVLADLLARRQVLLQVVAPAPRGAGRVAALGEVLDDQGLGAPARYLSAAPRADSRLAGRGYFYVAPARSWLVPGSSARIRLPTGRSLDAARVPASSLVWWQGRAWIFVRIPGGDFERREVPADGQEGADMLAADLAGGTEVVVQGAQVLLSEELRAENFSTDVGGR
jgi:hypothetical protein